ETADAGARCRACEDVRLGARFVNLEGQPDPLAAETDQDATAAVASPAQSTTDVLPATGTVEPDAGAADDDHGEGAGRRRRSRKPPKSTRRVVVEWVVLIAAALVIAFLIKTFLFQAFYIPSESMVPTLNVGDRVLVNKLSYDFHDVHRGDIVVFDAPPLARSNDIKDLVKRVIGLPGETVTYP